MIMILAASCGGIGPEIIKYRGKIEVNKEYESEKVIQPEQEGYVLITSRPGDGVFVYGKKQDGLSYFQQVLIKTRTAQKVFNWKATKKNPVLMLADVTGSGKNDIVLIFTTAFGTGFYESQIHVVDMGLTGEIPVENPIVSAQRLIKASVQGEEIVFNAGGRTYRVKPSVGSEGIQAEYSGLQYGNIVNYSIENSRLRAAVMVSTLSNSYLGEFILVYSYEEGRLVPRVTSFIKGR
jgi:hypothetical protein